MQSVQTAKPDARGPQSWPMSVATYHVLGEMALIPEKTELLYGQVYRKTPKSPLHHALAQRLLRLQIEVHQQPAGEQFSETAVHGPGGTVASSAVAEFAVELEKLFAP